MRTPTEIYNRLLWSEHSYDLNKIVIGYMDRFTGMQWISFHEFQALSEDEENLCIPWHRIWYFSIVVDDDNKIILWDRKTKFDIFI